MAGGRAVSAVDLGPSWLPGTEGTVTKRRVVSCRVTAVMGDLFSARVPGESHRQYFALTHVADGDAGLLARGARFWWLYEVVRCRGGVEGRSAIAFAREGVGAQEAFRPWTRGGETS